MFGELGIVGEALMIKIWLLCWYLIFRGYGAGFRHHIYILVVEEVVYDLMTILITRRLSIIWAHN